MGALVTIKFMVMNIEVQPALYMLLIKKHIQIIMLSALMAAKVLIGYNQPFVLLEAITIVKVNFSLLRIFTLSILEQSVLEEVVLSLLLNGLILLLPADMHGMSPPLML